ncbi:MAG TPA: uroporphyrinogen-III synthase [Stellaceae bacterium]|nr:uroporphyrinogen-III synthase [Stellaceae bacterium]
MKRALVTRPREEAEELAAALAARGLEALVEPLMEIRHRSTEGLDLGGVQAVLCTSANGVRALARATGERRVPLFAVGDATAARAREEGFERVTSAGGNAADLARLTVARLRPERGRLVHVAGSLVAGDLAGELSRHGFAVERQVLYEARPAEALSPAACDALRASALDVALFFSPRTAALFARLAATAGLERQLPGVVAVSISKAADAALAEHRWRGRVVAARPNQKALLEALDVVLAGHCEG